MSIADITACPDVQPRVALHYPTVEKYREAIDAREEFDSLRVMFDGSTNWLYDGFHRLEAFKLGGYVEVPILVDKGTKADAILKAAASNYKHGLQRGDADVERAIRMVIAVLAERGERWTQEEIARHCHCSQQRVSQVLATTRTSKLPSRSAKRSAVERALAEKPKASAREIAASVGVSHTTVENVRKKKAERGPLLHEAAMGAASGDERASAPKLRRGDDGARPVRQDRVLVPRGNDPSMYAVAGYSKRAVRDIDEIIIGALCSAVASLEEADWERLMRRVDMVLGERKAGAA